MDGRLQFKRYFAVAGVIDQAHDAAQGDLVANSETPGSR
jgi:hypothetical protein